MADPVRVLVTVASILAAPATLFGAFSRYAGWLRSASWRRRATATCAIFVATAFCLNGAFVAGWLIWPAGALETVEGRTFANESVALDNERYVNCRFDHVTFNWAGGPFAIEAATFVGPPKVETKNHKVMRALGLAASLSRMFPAPLDLTVANPH